MKRLITAAELRVLLVDGQKTLVIPPDSILSPSAKDLAKELHLELCREGSVTHVMQHPELAVSSAVLADKKAETEAKPKATATAKLSEPSESGECSQSSEVEIKELVCKVLAECLKPACANPKVTYVKGKEVVISQFDQAPPGQKVGLVDVITSREGNLGAGFMTYERSKLPWFLTYDEVDYVIEGEFHLEANNQLIKAGPGDVIYIPKNTQVVFSSPSYAKVFYTTYPSNWDELSGI